MSSLGKNRSFDIAQIQMLLDSGIQMADAFMSNAEQIEGIISKLQEVHGTVPGNYDPWEVSVYTWSECKFGKNVVLNQYSNEKGASIQTFLAVEYFINGFSKEDFFGSNLSGIVNNGYEYTIDKEQNELIVNSQAYDLPSNWSQREEAFTNAKKVFLEQ